VRAKAILIADDQLDTPTYRMKLATGTAAPAPRVSAQGQDSSDRASTLSFRQIELANRGERDRNYLFLENF
jgi:hypothetical protein